MDLEQARFNMVEQQIRPWDVLDQDILDLLLKLPREAFMPEAVKSLAFVDTEVPIGYGQVALPPRVQARWVQELDLQASDKVLQIGTGTGYMSALLASLSDHVYAVEIVPELAKITQTNLVAQGIHNVTVEVGDGARGWEKHRFYDAIVLTGSLPVLPDTFEESLAVGGRLLAVVGDAPAMKLQLTVCHAPGVFERTTVLETTLPVLKNAKQHNRFQL